MAKHYAISDIHGMYDIYEQVKEMLQPDDVVYFLGDAGDRGYDCFKCIKAIYNDPQWIYLKGNHEDMMAKSILQLPSLSGYADRDDFQIWMYNGGADTFDEWIADGRDEAWGKRLHDLPLTAEYTNDKGFTFHMSHAGYTCGRKDQMWGEELVWSRHHFASKWDEECYPKDICIHGRKLFKLCISDNFKLFSLDSCQFYLFISGAFLTCCKLAVKECNIILYIRGYFLSERTL